MPRVDLICDYCDHKQIEFLYEINLEILKCNVCGSKYIEKNVKEHPEKYDVFGYDKDEEWKRKYLKN